MSEEMKNITASELKALIVKKMQEVDVSKSDAEIIADVLVFADSRGIYSHGSLRVEHYMNRIRKGGMNLHPELKLKRLKSSIGFIDGQGGSGAVTTKFAMEKAIMMAKEEGLALVGINNNGHCGSLGYYVQMALESKMASMVLANTDACVIPFGAKHSFFGTNPFAFGYPGKKDSILLDMATSEAAFGKVLYAREKGVSIPEGWAVDENGRAVTNPDKAVSLLPFGGPKGYGINIMVEALTGLMIGGIFGPHLNKMYSDLDSLRDLSNVIIVIDPCVFADSEQVLSRSQAMFDELHAQESSEGVKHVMLPGEIELNNMKRAQKEGINIPAGILNFLSS